MSAATLNLVRYSSVTSISSYSSLEGCTFTTPLTQGLALPQLCVTSPSTSTATATTIYEERETGHHWPADNRSNTQTITDHVCQRQHEMSHS